MDGEGGQGLSQGPPTVRDVGHSEIKSPIHQSKNFNHSITCLPRIECVPLKCGNLTPSVTVWGGGSWEGIRSQGWNLREGTDGAPAAEPPRAPLPPCEDTMRRTS